MWTGTADDEPQRGEAAYRPGTTPPFERTRETYDPDAYLEATAERSGTKPPDEPGKKPKPSGDEPTGPSRDPDPNAEPGGTPTEIDPDHDAVTKRSLARENESAATLARAGYDVEQNPDVPGRKKPDYRIEGRIFDNIAPKTGRARNIHSRIEEKIEEGQTDRVVVNLADSPVEVERLRSQMRDWPIEGLKEVIVIDKNGNVLHLYP